MTDIENNATEQSDNVKNVQKSISEIISENKLKTIKLNEQKEEPNKKVNKGSVKEVDNNQADDKKIEVIDAEVKPEDNSEAESFKEELQKSENARKNARDMLSKVSMKLKNYEKRIAKLLNDGEIDSEYAEKLLSDISHDEDSEDVDSDLNEFQKLIKIGSNGLDRYRESIKDGIIDEDILLDKKVESFDFFMNEASHEEKVKVFEQLEKLKDKPILLAKKMLSIGNEYYEEAYKDFDEAGGFKRFKEKSNQEKEKLNKQVDKLNKEVLRLKEQYENFVEPRTMKLPSGGATSINTVKDYSIESSLRRARNGEFNRK
jgi:hypothetical protein